VADSPQMTFSQMHERLRLEMLRRIQRGTLSVSLLARQTGFGQAHMSNFLRKRRQLSLEALDRLLVSQHLTAIDLLPATCSSTELSNDLESSSVPVVTHAAALFEPYIRPSSVQSTLNLPAKLLTSTRARISQSRRTWQRFVAVSLSAADASAMEPLLLPNAIVLLDRHYTSLLPYRLNRTNLYAVRNGRHLSVRYLDFLMNRVVLRPHNLSFPVDLLEVAPGESPADLIAGRIVTVLNEV
jgi:hypothetical protein